MKKIWPHLILIPLLLGIPIISSPDYDGTLSVFRVHPFLREFIRFVMAILFFYINLFILLPKLFRAKHYVLYGLLVLGFYLTTVFVPFTLVPDNNRIINFNGQPRTENFQNPPPQPGNFRNMPPPKDGKNIQEKRSPFDKHPPQMMAPEHFDSLHRKLITSLLPFLFSFLCSLFIYKHDERIELEKAKAKADLLSLKYQLQPHFLFNILNSIYSLTLIKSDDAPESVIKLSNVMRYVVQESDKDFVELKNEIEYLKNYIALQLIRTDDSLDFSYIEIGEPKNLQIAPLILVNFVENAFKYGYNHEENSKISVEILIEGSELVFKVYNTVSNSNIMNEESLNVGQKNTVKRLEQLYPKQHSLKIDCEEKQYFIELKMNLSN